MQILDATETHYYVEVFAKMKKINIEHDKVSMKDEVVGSLTTDANRRQQSSTSLFSQATPYMQGATPMHGSSATPMYTGSETPMVGTPRGSTPRGGSTPSADDAYDPWKISSSHGINDRMNEHMNECMYICAELLGGNARQGSRAGPGAAYSGDAPKTTRPETFSNRIL